MYHMVRETDDSKEKRYCCHPDAFRKQMIYLKKVGYQVIGLDELANSMMNSTPLSHKSVVLTFDDGYMDNYENAFPVLREYDFPATVFVVSGLVGKGSQWATNEGYPERFLMGWREIEEIKRHGVAIGSHTVNHRRLTLLNPKDAKTEMHISKKDLEDHLGAPINHFAYPYGDTNTSVVNMVYESGYKTACSTRSGFNSEGVSLFELRRLDIYGTDSLWQFAIKLAFGTNEGNLLLPARYYMDRLSERIRQRMST